MSECMLWFKESELWASIDAIFTIVSILVTIGTLIMVVKNYHNNKKQLEEIDICLDFGDGNIKKIFPLKRKNFSRSELKGILREAHKSKENYEISSMSKASFLQNIFDIQDGKGTTFTIKIEKGDFYKYESN